MNLLFRISLLVFSSIFLSQIIQNTAFCAEDKKGYAVFADGTDPVLIANLLLEMVVSYKYYILPYVESSDLVRVKKLQAETHSALNLLNSKNILHRDVTKSLQSMALQTRNATDLFKQISTTMNAGRIIAIIKNPKLKFSLDRIIE